MDLTASTATNLWDGLPHHVVATRDGAGNAVIYVDNEIVGSGSGLTVDDIPNDSRSASTRPSYEAPMPNQM